MVCGSCGKRVDPTRSFCTHCGSSVFVDGSSAPKILPTMTSSPAEPVVRQQRPRIATKFAPPVRSSFRVWPLIKLAITLWILWYAVTWLLRIPEVRALKDGVQQGQVSDTDAQAALEALRARLNESLGGAPTTENSPTGSAQPVRRTPNPPQPRPVPQSPPREALPPGVFVPGNGVSMPRIGREVKPAYTPQALRAQIEGSVLLKGIVQPNGTVADVAVVRPLDPRYGLDQQAIAAVRQWRFEPGQRAGKPVPVFIYIEVFFTLDELNPQPPRVRREL